MKQFLITLLAVGVLASAAQAEARLMSTRGQCVAACGQAVSDSCGWITKRGRFNRCRAKLINQCKRWGTATMCPAPPPPTTTTTTVPYIPPTTTTTTLPAVPDLRGSYQFDGTVTSDPCGLAGVGTSALIPFAVTNQSGTRLGGVVGAVPRVANGTLFDDRSWNLIAEYCEDGCCFVQGVAVGDIDTPAQGVAGFRGECPGVAACVVELEGSVY